MMHWLSSDARLFGRWRSDRERTVAELAARTDFSDASKATLSNVFGKLELRYTRWRCYSTYDGTTESGRYRVVARDSSSVVLISRSVMVLDWRPSIRTRSLLHIHFEDDFYWMTLGRSNVREFFRRVGPP